MKIDVICAKSDLGVHIDGSNLGPSILTENIKLKSYIIEKENIVKSNDKNDLCKNLKNINNFTKQVFDTTSEILKNNHFPLLIGGDHSTVIGSALASQKHNGNIGIIWIDAHGDYNNFETTITGNIHGLPLAAITGYKCEKLTDFITNNYINPKNAVVVGARSIDPLEKENLIDAGVTIFTTDDIKNEGPIKIMEKAIEIASNNTNGIHISYDIDVIDPNLAIGVSVPEVNGIDENEAYEIMNAIIKNKNVIKSLDIVEYNPLRDINDKTKNIALNLINIFINNF